MTGSSDAGNHFMMQFINSTDRVFFSDVLEDNHVYLALIDNNDECNEYTVREMTIRVYDLHFYRVAYEKDGSYIEPVDWDARKISKCKVREYDDYKFNFLEYLKQYSDVWDVRSTLMHAVSFLHEKVVSNGGM